MTTKQFTPKKGLELDLSAEQVESTIQTIIEIDAKLNRNPEIYQSIEVRTISYIRFLRQKLAGYSQRINNSKIEEYVDQARYTDQKSNAEPEIFYEVLDTLQTNPERYVKKEIQRFKAKNNEASLLELLQKTKNEIEVIDQKIEDDFILSLRDL